MEVNTGRVITWKWNLWATGIQTKTTELKKDLFYIVLRVHDLLKQIVLSFFIVEQKCYARVLKLQTGSTNRI